MKKIITALLAVTVLMAGGTQVSKASADDVPKVKDMSIEVLVNARRVAFPDVRPQIKDGSTLIPLRFVSDTLGGELSLQDKQITIIKGDRTINLTIGSKTATVNGENVTLDTASTAINGRTLVPLRFVSEALGETVKWDSVNQYIWIGSTKVPTLEEVAEPVSIDPYLDLFYKGEHMLEFGDITRSQVMILTKNDFPIQFKKEIIYRIDYAQTSDGMEYFRSTSNSKAIIGMNIYLLQKGQPLKYRAEISRLREKVNAEMRISYHQVIARKDRDQLGIKDYKNIELKDIGFIGLAKDGNVAIFVRNDFAK